MGEAEVPYDKPEPEIQHTPTQTVDDKPFHEKTPPEMQQQQQQQDEPMMKNGIRLQKLEELKNVMKRQSLTREEKRGRLAEIQAKYATNNDADLSGNNQPTDEESKKVNNNPETERNYWQQKVSLEKNITNTVKLEELKNVMKRQSLTREEKRGKMAEIQAKYGTDNSGNTTAGKKESAAKKDGMSSLDGSLEKRPTDKVDTTDEKSTGATPRRDENAAAKRLIKDATQLTYSTTESFDQRLRDKMNANSAGLKSKGGTIDVSKSVGARPSVEATTAKNGSPAQGAPSALDSFDQRLRDKMNTNSAGLKSKGEAIDVSKSVGARPSVEATKKGSAAQGIPFALDSFDQRLRNKTNDALFAESYNENSTIRGLELVSEEADLPCHGLQSKFDTSKKMRKLKTHAKKGPELITGDDEDLPPPSSGAYENEQNRKQKIASVGLEMIDDDTGPPIPLNTFDEGGGKSNFKPQSHTGMQQATPAGATPAPLSLREKIQRNIQSTAGADSTSANELLQQNPLGNISENEVSDIESSRERDQRELLAGLEGGGAGAGALSNGAIVGSNSHDDLLEADIERADIAFDQLQRKKSMMLLVAGDYEDTRTDRAVCGFIAVLLVALLVLLVILLS